MASVAVRRVVEAADRVVLHSGARAVPDHDAVLGDVVDGTLAGDDVLLDRRGGLDAGGSDAIGGQVDDLDPVLLEVVDLVAADRAARAVDIGDGTAVLSAVERNIADLVDLAAGHVDVADAVDDDAVVLRAVDVSVADAGRVVDTDVAAGRVELAGDCPADLCGGEVDAVADEPRRGAGRSAARVAAGMRLPRPSWRRWPMPWPGWPAGAW